MKRLLLHVFACMLALPAWAQTPLPSTVYEGSAKLPIPAVAGRDGYIYGYTMYGWGPASRGTLPIVRTDGDDVRSIDLSGLNLEPFSRQSNTYYTLAEDSAGRFYGGSYPDKTGLDHVTPTASCPHLDIIVSTGEITSVTYGGLYWFNARHQPTLLQTGTNLCPLGKLAVDAEDNLYFFSAQDNFASQQNFPQTDDDRRIKLYKLASDRVTLTVLFDGFASAGLPWNGTYKNADATYSGPVDLIASSDGQWLYGTWGDLDGVANGWIWRIRTDGQDMQVLRRLPADGSEGQIVDAFSSQGRSRLYERGDNLVGFNFGGGRAQLFQISKDGSGFQLLYDESSTSATAVDSVTLGPDGNLYGSGSLRCPATSNTLSRYPLGGALATSWEALYTYPGGQSTWYCPALTVTGRDGRLYGTSSGGAPATDGQVLFSFAPAAPHEAPIIYLSADPPALAPDDGGSIGRSTIAWRVENLGAGSCTADWAGSGLGATGSAEVTPAAAGRNRYTLTCTDGSESASQDISVYLDAQPVTPAIESFAASAASVTMGNSFTLNWKVADALGCNALSSGLTSWSGSKAFDASGAGSDTLTMVASSSLTSYAAYTATFTLTCTGTGGTASRSVQVQAVPTDIAGITSHSGGGAAGAGFVAMLAALAALARRRERSA